MRVGGLFSGIGGLELGLEAAGMETVWQVECNPYALKVLEKHWPNAERYTDVRSFNATTAARVDLVCGGFPCQPHSLAGNRKASEDERDLWSEFARIICEAKPRWVVAENVSGLLSSEAGRYFGRVLGDLAALGYDAEWFVLPASAVGAPHRRERVFIVANAHGERQQKRDMSAVTIEPRQPSWRGNENLGNANSSRELQPKRGEQDQWGWTCDPSWWATEPILGRVAHGVPARVDRLRCLGNAVVPQVAYQIGKRILEVIE